VARVFARNEGHEYRIGNFGTVTHDRCVVVPAAVADELSSISVLRVEPDEQAAPAPRIAPKKQTPETTASAEKE